MTILTLCLLPAQLESTEEGQAVTRKFVAVSKEIRRYEQRLFEEWSASVNVRYKLQLGLTPKPPVSLELTPTIKKKRLFAILQ